jgi:acetolactate synthase-1/2/3 large subunit
LIEWKQETEFGKHVDLSFENPDFMMLADAFGWRGFRAENARDLRDTLEVAFDCGRPALVVVPIDYSENIKLSKRLGNLVCPI